MESTRWRWYDTPAVLAGGVLAALLAGLAAGIVFGPDSGTAEVLFWLVIPAQNLGIIGALVWLGRRRGCSKPARELGLEVEPRQGWWVLAGAGALLVLTFLAAGLLELLGVEPRQQAVLEQMIQIRGAAAAAVVIGVVILGPVAEELLYRGLTMQTVLQGGRPPALAVWVSAAVFALAHLADPSLFSAAGAVTLAQLFLFGLFLGAVRIRTGGLGAPIFVHSGFNLTTVLALFYGPDPTWSAEGAAAGLGLAGALLPFFAA